MCCRRGFRGVRLFAVTSTVAHQQPVTDRAAAVDAAQLGGWVAAVIGASFERHDGRESPAAGEQPVFVQSAWDIEDISVFTRCKVCLVAAKRTIAQLGHDF